MKRGTRRGPRVGGPWSEAERPEDESSDRLFRLLVDAVREYAIYLLDPDGRIMTWNRGAERLEGYTREEILGESFSVVFTEEDRRRGLPDEALRPATKRGRHEDEGWRVRSDGSRFWAHFAITPICDDDHLLGFAEVTQDLTQQRTAERELRESEERYRLLADMIPQHIWTTDPDGYHNYFSRRWYEYTGTTPEQTKGEGWLAVLHPEDWERTVARWQHSLQTGEPYAIEYRFRKADGKIQLVSSGRRPFTVTTGMSWPARN